MMHFYSQKNTFNSFEKYKIQTTYTISHILPLKPLTLDLMSNFDNCNRKACKKKKNTHSTESSNEFKNILDLKFSVSSFCVHTIFFSFTKERKAKYRATDLARKRPRVLSGTKSEASTVINIAPIDYALNGEDQSSWPSS
jgi:hypothetical protein